MPEATDRSGHAAPRLRDRSTFIVIIAATLGLQLLTLVTGVIIARVLGVEGRGVIALIFALGLFASQLTWGSSVPVAVTKALSERRVTMRDGLGGIARRRWPLLLPPSIAAATLMAVLHSGESVGTGVVLAVSAGLMALQTMVARIINSGLQGEGRLVRLAWVSMMPQLLFAVSLTPTWLLDWRWDEVDMLVAYFVSCFAALALAYRSLRRPTHRVEDRLAESALWSEARRSYISSVRPLDSMQLDRIVVGGVIGTVALGLYAAAAAVSNLCTLISNAVSTVVLPRVAAHHGDRATQRAVARRWLTVTAVLVVVTVAGLQLVVDPIIRLAFGEEFAAAIECARWLIVADGVMAVRKVLISTLQAAGHGSTASRIELVVLPLMLAAIVVVAAQGSLVGIAIALLSAGAVSSAALAVALHRALAA